MDKVQPFLESPLAVTLIGTACTALIIFAGAIIKMAIKLGQIESTMQDLRGDITGIRTEPDIMRWSDYGKASKAGLLPHQ